jgi:hypothetical protein
VPVPDTERETTREVNSGEYRIKTHDGDKYETGRFTKTESTLVITELYRGGKRIKVAPFAIPLDEIESVERIQAWWLGITIFSVLILGAALFGAYMWALAEGLGKLG